MTSRPKGWGKELRDQRIGEQKKNAQLINFDYNAPFREVKVKAPKKSTKKSTKTETKPNEVAPTQTKPEPQTIIHNNNNNYHNHIHTETTPSRAINSQEVVVFQDTIGFYEHLSSNNTSSHGRRDMQLVYNPFTTENVVLRILKAGRNGQVQLEIECDSTFSFIPLPNNSGTYLDPLTKRCYSCVFSSEEARTQFGVQLALLQDHLSAYRSHQIGGMRKIIQQDLNDSTDKRPCVKMGDTVRIKYSIYLVKSNMDLSNKKVQLSALPPEIGKPISRHHPNKFIVGSGTVYSGIELGIVNMKKRNRRFLVIPPFLFEETEWAPHAPQDVSICAFVEIVSHTVKESVEYERENKKSISTSSNVQQQQHQQHQQLQSVHHQPNPQPERNSFNQDMDHHQQQQQQQNENTQFSPQVSAHQTLRERMAKISMAGFGVSIGEMKQNPFVTAQSDDDDNDNDDENDNDENEEIYAKHPIHPIQQQHNNNNNNQNNNIDTELRELFKKLNLNIYISIFEAQEISLNDISLLSDDEMKYLIPKLGPRRRLLTALNESETATVKEEEQQEENNNIKNNNDNNDDDDESNNEENIRKKQKQAFELLLNRLHEVPRTIVDNEMQYQFQKGYNQCAIRAKNELDRVKKIARQRVMSLETEQQRKEIKIQELQATIAKASNIVKQLRKELAESENEKEKLVTRSREYVGKLKESRKNDQAQILRDSMETLYSVIKNEFQNNDVYDGEDLKRILKQMIKNTLS